jgi:hypothetical protein
VARRCAIFVSAAANRARYVARENVLDDLGFAPEQAIALKFKTEMYQAILKYAQKHSRKELQGDSRSSFRWFQADEELHLHEAVLEAGFAINRKRAGPLRSNEFPVANLRPASLTSVFAACSCAFCNSAPKHGSHIPPVWPPSPCRKR